MTDDRIAGKFLTGRWKGKEEDVNLKNVGLMGWEESWRGRIYMKMSWTDHLEWNKTIA